MENPSPVDSGKKEFWQRHIQQWWDSGLSQTDYCAQHRLKIYKFHYWRSKLKKMKVKTKPSPRLVPVELEYDMNLPTQKERVYSLKIHIGKALIEVGSDIPPEILRQFVQALEV